jgi:hypothetical protein
MKNTIFLLFFVLLLFQACNDDANSNNPVPTCENCNFTCVETIDSTVFTNNCIDNWECSFQVVSASEIDINNANGYTNGNKNVFVMSNYTQGDSLIADDEYTYSLVFELDANQNSFSVENNDLANMNIHFKQICFCASVEFIPLTSGCLQGEKQADGTWLIQGNLVAPYNWGNVEVKFDASFVQ